jgi:hypothetical protein
VPAMPVELVIAPEPSWTLQKPTSGMKAAEPDWGEEFLSSVDACLTPV